MRLRSIASLVACLLVVVPAVATAGTVTPEGSPAPPEDATVLVSGRGAAHGMGLAMDGVEGQARAGWSHDRILDLFYPGTATGSFGGTVRVGLADDPRSLAFTLPSGGRIADASGGLLADAPPGARVIVIFEDGRYLVDVPGGVRAAQGDPPIPLPSDDPEDPDDPTVPEPTPTPEPDPSPEASPEPSAPGTSEPIWITPSGDPALTLVEATGRRYRARMEVRFSTNSNSLWAINHVDLETYVMGIAEEKGQGWPIEGLKVLAVAARSLAASTMTWYERRHENGFDICPTGACQVYLGYDGEEPAMREATRQTAGQIRTYNGRSILAMYHGNGGGKTDEYELLYGNGRTDPHPYLSAVEYPYADPSSWRLAFTPEDVTTLLAESGVSVPGAFRGAEVLETGVSPRVVRMRIEGSEGTVDTAGRTFQAALDLPSAWFEVGEREEPVPVVAPDDGSAVRAGARLVPFEARDPATPVSEAPEASRPWVLLALALLCAAAVALVAGDPRFARELRRSRR